jgi:hypothetical protein
MIYKKEYINNKGCKLHLQVIRQFYIINLNLLLFWNKIKVYRIFLLVRINLNQVLFKKSLNSFNLEITTNKLSDNKKLI